MQEMQSIVLPIDTRPITEEEETALGFSPRRGMLDLDIYTLKDLAERLDLTTATIKNHIKKGVLKPVNFGNRGGYRFLRHNVYEWLISLQSDLHESLNRGRGRPKNISNRNE